MKFKYFAAVCLAAVAAVALLGGCGKRSAKQIFLSKTGLKAIPDYEYVTTVETHGGFHGDGETYYSFVYSEENGGKLFNQLSENKLWRKTPLDATVKLLACGSDEYSSVFNIPDVQNGYYFFYDEQTKSFAPPAGYMENSYSYNFRIAVYDADNYVLYYCELDT